MTETTIFKLWERGIIGSICEMSKDPETMLTAIRLALYGRFKNLALDNPGEPFENREVRLQLLKEQGVVAQIKGDFLVLSCDAKGEFKRLKLNKACVEGQI